jgi:hypothetical protein
MATSYTSLLGLALPVTGELSGTWGDTVNDAITSLLDTAVAGTTTLSTDGDVTLTTTTGASNQARQAILLCSGARTALRTITAPAQSKIYTIINATTGGYAVKLVGSGPTTGLTIPNGASAVVAWNGSDFIEVGSATVGNLTVNGNLSVTGTTTLTGAATLTANPTLSAGTANGVAYLNGSKVLTTGSALTFNGTGLGVGISSAGYLVDISTPLTGTTVGSNVALNIESQASGRDVEIRMGDTVNSSGRFGYLSGSLYWAFGSTEAMRLTSTGLGIGTSSPSYKLHVLGSASSTVSLFEASTTDAYIGLKNTGVTGYVGLTNAGNFIWQTPSSSYATKLTLDNAGNLGLGVTPSAWTTLKPIEFSGGASLAGFSNTGYLNANAYFNGSWRYIASAASGRYEVADSHKWFTAPSGTAGDAISFTQAMTLDASGNWMLGTTSPADSAAVATITGNTVALVQTFGSVLRFNKTAGTDTGWLSNRSYGWHDGNGLALSTQTADPLRFGTNSTERARIDSSGNLLVGTTAGSARVVASHPSDCFVGITTQTSGNSYFGYWIYNGSNVGSITSTGTSTAYNTSSDYRLKENIQPMTGALAKVAALKPCTYNWKADGSDGEGFIAHELQAVVPQCVTGEKDAVDDDGNPQYQGIDTSFLVATLTAAIQELKAEFDAYKASHP